jgi:phage tail sheath gpL-like
MGINAESDVAASLQIGPTSAGMVRIYVEGDGLELPLDFAPEEAEEIAEEIRAAAARAREVGATAGKAGSGKDRGGQPGAKRRRRSGSSS